MNGQVWEYECVHICRVGWGVCTYVYIACMQGMYGTCAHVGICVGGSMGVCICEGI